MTTSAELRAALAVAELEEDLIARKAAGDTDGPEFLKLKSDLRAARQAHRELRAGEPPADGDAAANPPIFGVTTAVLS